MNLIATLLFCIVFVFTSTAFASKKPLPPKFSGRVISQTDRFFAVQIPTFYEGNTTKIEGLYKLLMYLNGSQSISFEYPLNEDMVGENIYLYESDTNWSKFLQLLDSNKYYTLRAQIISHPLGEKMDTSNFSDEHLFYFGEVLDERIIEYSENFESTKNKLNLFKSSNWNKSQIVSKSKNSSITNGGLNGYQNNQIDTILFTPMNMFHIAGQHKDNVITNQSEHFINFWHIFNCEKGDSAFIELSGDMVNWTKVKTFTSSKVASWQDNAIDDTEWMLENINYKVMVKNDGINYGSGCNFLRLRFKSDSIGTSKGWFIDDIYLKSHTVGVESEEKAEPMAIYPNPASDVLYLGNKSNIGIRKIELITLLGTTLLELNEAEISQTTKLDTRNLVPGKYLLKVTDNKGRTVIQQVGVVR